MSIVISGITHEEFVSRLQLALNEVAGYPVGFRKRNKFMKNLFNAQNEHMVKRVFAVPSVEPQVVTCPCAIKAKNMSNDEILDRAAVLLDDYFFVMDWGNGDSNYFDRFLDYSIHAENETTLSFVMTVDADNREVVLRYGVDAGDGNGIADPAEFYLKDVPSKSVANMNLPKEVPKEEVRHALKDLNEIHKALCDDSLLSHVFGLYAAEPKVKIDAGS